MKTASKCPWCDTNLCGRTCICAERIFRLGSARRQQRIERIVLIVIGAMILSLFSGCRTQTTENQPESGPPQLPDGSALSYALSPDEKELLVTITSAPRTPIPILYF